MRQFVLFSASAIKCIFLLSCNHRQQLFVHAISVILFLSCAFLNHQSECVKLVSSFWLHLITAFPSRRPFYFAVASSRWARKETQHWSEHKIGKWNAIFVCLCILNLIFTCRLREQPPFIRYRSAFHFSHRDRKCRFSRFQSDFCASRRFVRQLRTSLAFLFLQSPSFCSVPFLVIRFVFSGLLLFLQLFRIYFCCSCFVRICCLRIVSTPSTEKRNLRTSLALAREWVFISTALSLLTAAVCISRLQFQPERKLNNIKMWLWATATAAILLNSKAEATLAQQRPSLAYPMAVENRLTSDNVFWTPLRTGVESVHWVSNKEPLLVAAISRKLDRIAGERIVINSDIRFEVNAEGQRRASADARSQF